MTITLPFLGINRKYINLTLWMKTELGFSRNKFHPHHFFLNWPTKFPSRFYHDPLGIFFCFCIEPGNVFPPISIPLWNSNNFNSNPGVFHGGLKSSLYLLCTPVDMLRRFNVYLAYTTFRRVHSSCEITIHANILRY